ncbi:hypothetical protein L3X07_07590 [Levilactobacillus brevis]|nr:hypothetical protein [Levilactobacillus brevis]
MRPIVRADKHAQIMLALFQKGMGSLRFQAMTNMTTRAMQQFFGQLPVMKTEIDRWHKQQQTVVLLVQDEERLAKIEQTLDDFEIQAVLTKSANLQPGLTQLVPERLQTGFEYARSLISCDYGSRNVPKGDQKTPPTANDGQR